MNAPESLPARSTPPADGRAAPLDFSLDSIAWNEAPRYVPLMPTANLRLHEAHADVPAPAFLSTAAPVECTLSIPT
ncbi:MAG: hypothetical protein IT428_13290 [Planctomycetaceae bacterium]|nr:hypothetical protein [Planctomycetaceae bacterium]